MKTNKTTLKISRSLILIILSFIADGLNAQVKIGDNETTINPASLLELESKTRGLLLPRMTSTEMNAISNPPEGLFVFNTTDSCIFSRRNNAWVSFCDPNSTGGDHDWYISGSTTIPTTINSNIMTGGSVSIGDITDVSASGTHSMAVGDAAAASGDRSIALGNSVTAAGNESFATGINSRAVGNFSLASGSGNIANRHGSFAGGRNCLANGLYSMAFGSNDTTSGFATVAMGFRNKSTDNYAVSMGIDNTSSGLYSFSMGQDNIADGNHSVALGMTTRAYGNTSMALGSNSITTGTNALAGGNGSVANGNNSIAFGFGDTTTGLGSAALGYSCAAKGNYSFAIGNNSSTTGAYGIAMGNGAIAGANEMVIKFGANTVTFDGSSTWAFSSDKRLKENIEPMQYGLAEVLKMKPSTYEYKTFMGTTSLGFIAQEMEEIIPEVVGENENGYKNLSYTELIPVLTKAIQEQQAQIEALKVENATLKAEANTTAITLEARLNALMLLMEQNGIDTTASK